MDDYDSMLNVVEDLPDESIAENEIVSDEEGEIGQGQVRSRSRGRADEQAPKSIAGRYSEEDGVYEEEEIVESAAFEDKTTPSFAHSRSAAQIDDRLSTITEETMSRANESDIYSVPNSRRFTEEFPRSSIKSNCADRTLKALKESTRERQMGGKEEEWEERLSDSDEFVDGVEARARILEEEKQFENSPRSKFCELDGRWENLNHEKENSWEPSYHTPPRPQAHSPYSPLTQMDKTQQHNKTGPLKIEKDSKDAEEIQRKLQEEIMHNAKAKNPALDRLRSLRSQIPVRSPSSPSASASTSIRHQTSALANQDNSMCNVFSTSIPSSPGQHIVSTPKGVPFGSRLPRPRFEEMFGDISRIGQTQLEGPESSQQQSQAQSSSESIVFRQGDIKQLLKASKSDPSKLIELLDAQRRNARGNKLPPQPIPVTVERKSVEVRKEVPVTAEETSRRKEESRDKQTKRDETKQVVDASNVHRVKQKQVSPLSIYTTRILFGCVSLNDQLKMTEVIKNNTDQEIIVTATVDSKSKLGGFQAKIKGANRAMLKAGEEAILETSFCPSITGRFQSACILKALPHDVTYKIPLLGWGDTAKLDVVCGGDVQMGRNGDFAMVTSNFATLKFELKNSGRREAYAKIQLLWSKDGTPISSALFFPSDQIVIARGKTQEVMIRLPDQLSEMLQQLQLTDRPDSAMSTRSSRSTSRISTVSSQFESSATTQYLSQSPQRFKIRIYWGEELLRRRLRDLEQATAPENRGDYQFNGISFTGQFLHEEATNRYDCFPNRKDDWRMFQVSIRTIDITVRPNRINSISRQRSIASLVPDNLTVHQLLDPEATLLGSPRQHMSTVIQEDFTRLNSILK